MSIPSTPLWQTIPQTDYQINSTAISADGCRCLLGTSKEYDSGQFEVCCYDQSGQLQWQDPITDGQSVYQGVFWVALSGNGRYAAAGGINKPNDSSENTTDNGFLFIYDANNGKRLISESLASRVNQVCFSEQGKMLIAVAGNELLYYGLFGSTFECIATLNLGSEYCQSCQISADGTRAVIGTTNYSNSDQHPDYTGKVIALNLSPEGMHILASYEADVGIQRVALTQKGDWWAASTHAGSALAFHDTFEKGHTPVWSYTPDTLNLGLSYAVAIAERDAEVYVTLGVNLYEATNGGALYTLSCPASATAAVQPALCWQHTVSYGVNPGVNMDAGAKYVTATDGQPASHTEESAGNFYLFDVSNHAAPLLWQMPTSQMNWPMAISTNGNAIFGASDNGTAYYWGQA